MQTKMSSGNSFFSVLFVATLTLRAVGDVVVETKRDFRPFRVYKNLQARFGDALPEDGLVGYLMKAEPLHACAPIAPPPVIDPEPGTQPLRWIAIIRRSESGSQGEECTFQDKVRAAMVANYSAAIIYNHENDELIHMGGYGDDLTPSVFIGFSDGNWILEHYTFSAGNREYVVRITDNGPFDIDTCNQVNLLTFAIVVGICFIIMLGIMLVFKCIQDRGREKRHRIPKGLVI